MALLYRRGERPQATAQIQEKNALTQRRELKLKPPMRPQELPGSLL
jgi:hypothetical protein